MSSDPTSEVLADGQRLLFQEDIDGVWHIRSDDFWDRDIHADVRAHTICGRGIWSCHASTFDPREVEKGALFCEPCDEAEWYECPDCSWRGPETDVEYRGRWAYNREGAIHCPNCGRHGLNDYPWSAAGRRGSH